MYVWLYVCMYVCTYRKCMYGCIMDICMYVCMYVCMCGVDDFAEGEDGQCLWNSLVRGARSAHHARVGYTSLIHTYIHTYIPTLLCLLSVCVGTAWRRTCGRWAWSCFCFSAENFLSTEKTTTRSFDPPFRYVCMYVCKQAIFPDIYSLIMRTCTYTYIHTCYSVLYCSSIISL